MAAAIKANISAGSRILLAVSGGKDSVVLLHGCIQLKNEFRLTIGVAHVDHALRPESKKDAEFVKNLAATCGAEFFTRRLKPPARKVNLEAWGRSERYKFFAEIKEKHRYDWLLTAHTASDVAETFLMRLVANKELKSIEGIDHERRLLRPLISIPSTVILEYLRSEKLSWVEDATNEDERFLRNKVRRYLLPFLSREFDPRIEETLTDRARAVSEDIGGLNEMVRLPLERIAKFEFGTKSWLQAVRNELAHLPPVLDWRLAEFLLKPLLGFNLGRAKSKELASFLKGESAGIELPGGVRLTLFNGGLRILN